MYVKCVCVCVVKEKREVEIDAGKNSWRRKEKGKEWKTNGEEERLKERLQKKVEESDMESIGKMIRPRRKKERAG